MPVHMFARQLVSLRHFRPSFSEQHWCRWTGSSRRQLSRRRAVAAVDGEPAAAAAVEGYLTLAGQHSSELEVKKSRFLTTAWPVGSAEEVGYCSLLSDVSAGGGGDRGEGDGET